MTHGYGPRPVFPPLCARVSRERSIDCLVPSPRVLSVGDSTLPCTLHTCAAYSEPKHLEARNSRGKFAVSATPSPHRDGIQGGLVQVIRG